MEANDKIKRKKVLVDKLSQSKFAIIIIVYLIVYTILLSFIVYLPTLWVLSTSEYPVTAEAKAARDFLFLEKRYLIPLFLIMFLMGLHSIRITHKFFGPIYRFKYVAEKVLKGDLSVRVVLRKNDYLRDYQNIFNSMIDSFDKKYKEINYISLKNSLLLTEILADMGKGKLSANEVGNRINEVLQSLNRLASLTERSVSDSK